MKPGKIFKYTGIVLASLPVLLLVFLFVFDWNWIRGYVNERLSRISDRTIRIEGDIDVDPGWTIQIHLEQVRVENAEWGSEPQMMRVETATVHLDLMELLGGNIVIPELSLEDPWLLLETSQQGRSNWQFSSDDTAEKSGENTAGSNLPVIGQMEIENGEIRYIHHGDSTDLQGTIETVQQEDGGNRVRISANGTLRGQSIDAVLTGDPLTDLQEETISYQVRLNGELENTRVDIEGTIEQPLQFSGMTLQVLLQGPDAATFMALWGVDFPETADYRLEGRLILEDGVWHVSGADLAMGDSRLGGDVTVDPTGERPLIEADLQSEVIDIPQVMDLLAGDEAETEAEKEEDEESNLLTAFNADIVFQADDVILPGVPLEGIGFHLLLSDGRLRLDPLTLALAGGSLQASATLTAEDAMYQGDATVQIEEVDMGALDIGGNITGILDGSLTLELPPTDDLSSLLSRLKIENSNLHYTDPDTGTEVRADLQTEQKEGEDRLTISGTGQYQGQPLAFSVAGKNIADLLDPETPLQVETETTLGDATASIQADVVRRDNKWTLENIRSNIAGSDLEGNITVATEGDRPQVTADIQTGSLDLEQLSDAIGSIGEQVEAADLPGEMPDIPETDVEPFDLGMFRKFDADITLQADEIVTPADIPLRNVDLTLDLEDGQLSVQPLQFHLDGTPVTARLSLDAEESPLSGSLSLAFDRLDLDAVLDPLTDLEEDLGVLSGELEMIITEAAPEERGRDVLLPFLGRLVIEESRFTYAEPAEDTRIILTIETETASDGEQTVLIDGDGRYQGEPFDLAFRGDPLLDIREPEDPYALDLAMEAAATQAQITGHVQHLLDLKGFDFRLEIAGPNPARLYPLIGLSLPDLPPYDVKGQLSLADDTWRFQNFEGRVGDSDLSGDIRVDTGGIRPFLEAGLVSQYLDFDDLAGLLGAAPDTGAAETASPAQRVENVLESRDRFVLPDEPYSLERLTAIDATVEFRGKRVMAQHLPLNEVVIRFGLDNGRMTFTPLKFGIGAGSIGMQIDLDTRMNTLKGTVETEIRRVNLKQVLQYFEIADESFGMIGGRAKYWVNGRSIAELLASADGGLYLLMTGGQLDSLLIELAGLDFGEALITYFSGSDPVNIDCAYADLHSRSGKMSIETFLVDTIDTLFTASGYVDFNYETVNILLHPHPKDFSLLSANVPLQIDGIFYDLDVSPDESELASRGAAAIGLGLIAGPAALLPLIETGTGDEPPLCEGMIESIEEARQ